MIDSEKTSDGNSVSFSTIGIIILSLIIGVVAGQFFVNLHSEPPMTFSTLSLIGFTLSVIVSGASIVLAIAAIYLGRSSERSVVDRTDESIRLQTEIFTKTTEALQQIASSTGVTEKRIEDLVPRIVELSKSGRSEQEIESEVRNSLRANVDPEVVERRRREREKEAEIYHEFKNQVLKAFSSKSDFIAEKMGDGSYSGEGLDLFDGVYRYNASIFGCAAIGPNAFDMRTLQSGVLPSYLPRVAKAIFDKKIDRAYLVFLSETDITSQTEALIKETLEMIKGNPSERIEVLVGTVETIPDKIAQMEVEIANHQAAPSQG